MRVLLALTAFVATALSYTHSLPASPTYFDFAGGVLSIIACSLSIVVIRNHFKSVKEPNLRETTSIVLIVSGLAALLVAYIAFFALGLIFNSLATWPFMCAAGGVAEIAVGASLSIPGTYTSRVKRGPHGTEIQNIRLRK